MHKTLPVLIVVLHCVAQSHQKFIIPDVTITPLAPQGLKVQLPDSEGVQTFGFHANINQAIKGKEEGTISKEVRSAEKGFWSFEDKTIQLKPGDTLHYWIFIQHNRLGFDKQDQQFHVTELTTGDKPATPGPCKTTDTKRNDGQSACGGELIFEDNFNDNNIDESKWTKEQYIPWEPDYEFCSYENKVDNCYIDSGSVCLKSTVRTADANILDLSVGCTGNRCTAPMFSIPPAVSGQITSRFSFLYGKIEIRAKLPTADWIYPQLYLLPKSYEYGPGYSSGRIWIAYARGNVDLKTKSNEDIGNNVLYSGPVLSADDPTRSSLLKKKTGTTWGNNYHTYAITWRPDSISVTVDGAEEGTIRPPNGAYSSLKNTAQLESASSWLTNNAPFDKEFVISLGLGVGGYADFPEFIVNNGKDKPWQQKKTRAQFQWADAIEDWNPTWSSDRNVLKVDYVKVWAL